MSDGSLPEEGFEINTAPAQGDLFIGQIEAISKALLRDGARVSSGCGLHVHVDARDFSYYDLRRLVLLYERIEPALFEMMPASRRESRFCQPCGKLYAEAVRANRLPKIYKENLIKSVYGDEAKRPARRDKYDDSRYHALNIHSWFYRGTIECRLHTGSVRAHKIIAWGKLWATILDTAMRRTERDIADCEGNARNLLLSIAPDGDTRDYITLRHAQHSRKETV